MSNKAGYLRFLLSEIGAASYLQPPSQCEVECLPATLILSRYKEWSRFDPVNPVMKMPFSSGV